MQMVLRKLDFINLVTVDLVFGLVCSGGKVLME